MWGDFTWWPVAGTAARGDKHLETLPMPSKGTQGRPGQPPRKDWVRVEVEGQARGESCNLGEAHALAE